MNYRKLGQSDIETTVIAMGTWAIGGDSMWGHSEEVVGNAKKSTPFYEPDKRAKQLIS